MFTKCVVATEYEDVIASYEYEKGMVLPSKSNVITFEGKFYRVLNLNFNYDLGLIMIVVEPWVLK